jgi:hypothetical protein
MQMTKEQCKTWIAALRSGKYKQGKGGFKRISNNSYCCLGVAAEVCNVVELRDDTCGIFAYWVNSNQDYTDFLPEEFIPTDIQQTLVLFNDEEEYTFPELADYIEQKILPMCKDE